MGENWRPVVGYEGHYDVSDMGRVRSRERLVKANNGGKRISPSKILVQSDRKGYSQVSLCRDSTQVNVSVHVLVAAAFICAKPDNMQICHNNGVPKDNRACNLRYGTIKDNAADRVAHGTEQRGEKHYNCKLSARNIRIIRMLKGIIVQTELASIMGVSQAQISDIQRGKSWAWMH